MEEKIRKFGWVYEVNHLRPLFWEEYQKLLREPLPFGWSIVSEPEEGADYMDYHRTIGETIAKMFEQKIARDDIA